MGWIVKGKEEENKKLFKVNGKIEVRKHASNVFKGSFLISISILSVNEIISRY
jgi:hypothetical protein